MKRALALALTMILCLCLLASCGSNGSNGGGQQSTDTPPAEADGPKQVDKLSVYFVPSREPSEIVTATEPLKQMLKDAMLEEGYDIGEVEITVGTTYEAVGEALVADTADVGLIPGGTYRTLCFLRFKNLVSPNT